LERRSESPANVGVRWRRADGPMSSREERTGGLQNVRGDGWRAVIQGVAVLVLAVVILAALWLLRRPLALLLFGIVIAEALEPLVNWLERRMPRVGAVLLVYLVLVLVVAGILYLVIPPFIDQVQAVIDRAPELINRMQSFVAKRNLRISQDIASSLYQQMGSVGFDLIRLPLTAFTSAFDLVVIAFISLYWLIQAPGITRFTLSLVPQMQKDHVSDVLDDMGRAMGGYLRGTAINGAILGVATYIALSIIGVDYPLVLGLITALLEFVPVVGATISAVLIVLVALSESTSLALLALAVAVVLQQIENHVLVPNVMHSQTNISPLLAVLAIVAGATLGGVIGAFISIPVAAALQVFIARVVAPAVRRRTGAPQADGRSSDDEKEADNHD
jgi:predicted PurR-regulated permease PerM